VTEEKKQTVKACRGCRKGILMKRPGSDFQRGRKLKAEMVGKLCATAEKKEEKTQEGKSRDWGNHQRTELELGAFSTDWTW